VPVKSPVVNSCGGFCAIIPPLLGALLSGVVIGAILGFVGAGGAMLAVPMLIYFFNFSAPTATTAALAIVIAAAALVLIIAATSMLIKPVVGTEKKVPLLWLLLISLAIGTITGLFGIGGGFLAIPILVLFFKTPPAKAAGTSLLIIVLNSIIAFLSHYAIWSAVNWKIPLAMAISAVVIARLASLKASTVSPQLLKRAFAYLLITISAFTLIHTWLIF
jgi:uncharacterized membrane protein YfcA